MRWSGLPVSVTETFAAGEPEAPAVNEPAQAQGTSQTDLNDDIPFYVGPTVRAPWGRLPLILGGGWTFFLCIGGTSLPRRRSTVFAVRARLAVTEAIRKTEMFCVPQSGTCPIPSAQEPLKWLQLTTKLAEDVEQLLEVSDSLGTASTHAP